VLIAILIAWLEMKKAAYLGAYFCGLAATPQLLPVEQWQYQPVYIGWRFLYK
jgi:hypothetical protein